MFSICVHSIRADDRHAWGVCGVLLQEATEETEKGPRLCFLCCLLFENPAFWLHVKAALPLLHRIPPGRIMVVLQPAPKDPAMGRFAPLVCGATWITALVPHATIGAESPVGRNATHPAAG